MDLIRTMIGLASSVAAFLEERCIRSSSLEIEKDRLHRAYSEWCFDRGQVAMTKTGLSQGLQTLGVGTGQSRSLGRILGDRSRPWVYKGVDLREP